MPAWRRASEKLYRGFARINPALHAVRKQASEEMDRGKKFQDHRAARLAQPRGGRGRRFTDRLLLASFSGLVCAPFPHTLLQEILQMFWDRFRLNSECVADDFIHYF